MLFFKVAIGGGYIAFSKDRSEGARTVCLDSDMRNFQRNILTLLTKSEGHSVVYCRLEEY